jgi:lipopolysaccharide export system protein LptA
MIERLLLIPAFGLFMGSAALAEDAAPTTPDTSTTTTTPGATGDKQTDIVADQMEILDKEHRATFTGNVDMKRPDVHWTCDQMVISYEDAKQPDGTTKSQVTTVDSTGNVTIVNKSQTITGNWAKMDVKANKLQVGGNVKVVQGKSILYGELMKTDLNTNKTEFSGGRVKGSFLPK